MLKALRLSSCQSAEEAECRGVSGVELLCHQNIIFDQTMIYFSLVYPSQYLTPFKMRTSVNESGNYFLQAAAKPGTVTFERHSSLRRHGPLCAEITLRCVLHIPGGFMETPFRSLSSKMNCDLRVTVLEQISAFYFTTPSHFGCYLPVPRKRDKRSAHDNLFTFQKLS